MNDSKKKSTSQTFTLELPAVGELRLERIEAPKSSSPKPTSLLEDDVNEDLIRRLINRLKKM